MQKPLDPFSFKKNVYERPGHHWVCGHAAEGRACPLGPDERGNCRHTGECIPARKDDRWMCTRSEAQGGKCANGPLPDGTCAFPIPPCQPVRSMRKWRAMFVWCGVALTTGALLILFSRPFRHYWIDPGPLANSHATSAIRCGDCHSLEPDSGTPFVPDSLGQRVRNDSALCLKCHQQDQQPLHAHGLEPAALAQLKAKMGRTNDAKQSPVLLRISHAVAERDTLAGDLACATCHQEHHGRKFSLTRLTDAQCQACHSIQFASFGKGHPEFSGYPYQRRTRIFFDHNSHLKQHFSERKENTPSSCQDCHVPGEGGRFMQVKNFDVTCGACHSGQIKGEGMTSKGVAFFTLPGIDVDALAAKGIGIGDWPKLADGKITPFMELLFVQESATRAALEKLHGVDLLDLTKATPEQLAAVEQFAWAVKTLLYHLVVEGQSYLSKEMKNEVGPAGLELPRAALIAAQKEWIPHLLTEVASYQQGIKPPLPERPKPPPAASPNPAAEKPTAGDESLLGGEDLAAAPTASSAQSTPARGGDLSGRENDKPKSRSASPAPSPKGSEDLTSGDLLGATPAPSLAPVPASSPVPEMIPAEEWVAAGGWYRPQESFTLFYRPVGHADPFLGAWLNAAARLESEIGTAEEHDAFEKLTDPQTPGICMKCHTIEKSSGTTVVNWQPARPNTKSRPFTTFSHTAHFSLVGDAGCQTCHRLNPKSQYPKFFSGVSETALPSGTIKFESNFSPISRMLCVQCHQPTVAGDACILCHRYHAAPVGGQLSGIGRFRTSSGKRFHPVRLVSKEIKPSPRPPR